MHILVLKEKPKKEVLHTNICALHTFTHGGLNLLSVSESSRPEWVIWLGPLGGRTNARIKTALDCFVFHH